MIRINLLPARAAKKKESARFQLTVAGLITFLVLAASLLFYVAANTEATGLREDIKKGEQDLNVLKKKIGELAKIKEQKKIVQDKLDIIVKLEAAKTGPSDLFKVISESIPEKAWLVSIKDMGRTVSLKGYAASDEVVAEFMRTLQKNGGFGAVELEVVQRTPDKETGAEVSSFGIVIVKQAVIKDKNDKNKGKNKGKS